VHRQLSAAQPDYRATPSREDQMRDSIQPAWLARSRRADLLAVALPLLAGLLVAGCTGSPGTSPAPTHSVTGWGSPNAQVLIPRLAH
jgi:hypothetical protein